MCSDSLQRLGVERARWHITLMIALTGASPKAAGSTFSMIIRMVSAAKQQTAPVARLADWYNSEIVRRHSRAGEGLDGF